MPAAKKFSYFVAALLLFVMALFLSAPAKYAKCVLDGISLWATKVLPATFPFLVLTALLTGLPPYARLSEKLAAPFGRLFALSGADGGVAILAALSGYPVGARMVLDLKERGLGTPDETFRLSCLATTSGPTFFVGTAGGVLYGSAAAGWIMLLCHLAAVWAVCALLRVGKGTPKGSPPPMRAVSFSDSLQKSVLSVLCVGGLISLFFCLSEMLETLGAVRAVARLLGGNVLYAEGLVHGLLEMTAGCAVLSAELSPLSLATSCGLVTFGGLCVLSQELAFLAPAGVKTAPFLCVKCIQAAVAFLICLGLSSLLL